MADANAKLEAPADFAGPGKNRRCTDIPCCLLLIVAWVAMTGLGLIATGAIANDDLPPGNPMRLVNPMDYMANICGIDDKVREGGV